MNACGLHFIIGNKGACKTMLACQLTWRLIAETNRHVVTNLPIKWDGLELYMQRKFPNWEGRVRERITQVEELPRLNHFFRIRGQGWVVPDVRKEQWDLGQRLDYRFAYRWRETEADVAGREDLDYLTTLQAARLYTEGQLERIELRELPAVQYVIDEIQNVFPSRAWTKQGPELLFYLTQQRKFSDDIIAISQRPGLMDKQLRELCDDWLFLENYGRKQRGMFRMPNRAVWNKFDHLPERGSTKLVGGQFAVNVDQVGDTYDTSAGVGIEGGLQADIGARPKGVHWSWALVIAAVVILGVMQLPGGLTHIVGWALSGRPKAIQASSTPVAGIQPSKLLSRQEETIPGAGVGKVVRQERVEKKTDDVRLTGVTTIGGVAVAYFEDGQVLSSRDPGWEGLVRRAGRVVGVMAWGREWLVSY